MTDESKHAVSGKGYFAQTALTTPAPTVPTALTAPSFINAAIKKSSVIAEETPICYSLNIPSSAVSPVWALTDMLMARSDAAAIWAEYESAEFVDALPVWDEADAKMMTKLAAKYKQSEQEVKGHYAAVVARNLEVHLLVPVSGTPFADLFTVGFGFYKSFSFLNHSCSPNVCGPYPSVRAVLNSLMFLFFVFRPTSPRWMQRVERSGCLR